MTRNGLEQADREDLIERALSAHAAQIGAEAIAILPPRYFKPASIDVLVGDDAISLWLDGTRLACLPRHAPTVELIQL